MRKYVCKYVFAPIYLFLHPSDFSYYYYYCVSENSRPICIVYTLYKDRQDFLDIQFIPLVMEWWSECWLFYPEIPLCTQTQGYGYCRALRLFKRSYLGVLDGGLFLCNSIMHFFPVTYKHLCKESKFSILNTLEGY